MYNNMEPNYDFLYIQEFDKLKDTSCMEEPLLNQKKVLL